MLSKVLGSQLEGLRIHADIVAGICWNNDAGLALRPAFYRCTNIQASP